MAIGGFSGTSGLIGFGGGRGSVGTQEPVGTQKPVGTQNPVATQDPVGSGGVGMFGAFESGLQQFEQVQMQQRKLMELQRQMKVGPVATSGNVPAGSLIVADNFTPSEGDKFAHGETVARSARFDGFRGPVRTLSPEGASAEYRKASTAQDGFYKANSTPAETRANVSNYALGSTLGVLSTETEAVQAATASGAKNSALNISQGRSRADIASSVYSTASYAWSEGLKPEHKEFANGVSQNFADAYGLDMAKLKSQNPKVSGPERLKLQEAIIGSVDSSISESPQVRAAKNLFTTEVNRFESNRNSVVISSGNEGDVIVAFKKDASGLTPRNLPKNFDTNVLDTPQATMVGATRWFDNGNGLTEKVADYSSVQSGVDIFASGSVATKVSGQADTFGTSFAAPRVAATMATLHKLNPSMSSSQIENLMKSSLTHNLNSGNGGQIDVLDYQMSSNLMVGRAN